MLVEAIVGGAIRRGREGSDGQRGPNEGMQIVRNMARAGFVRTAAMHVTASTAGWREKSESRREMPSQGARVGRRGFHNE